MTKLSVNDAIVLALFAIGGLLDTLLHSKRIGDLGKDGTTEAAPRGWQLNLQWNVVLGPHSEPPLLAILASDVERLGPP